MISHVKLQTEIAINILYVSVPRWRPGFECFEYWCQGIKRRFRKKTHEKERQERLQQVFWRKFQKLGI